MSDFNSSAAEEDAKRLRDFMADVQSVAYNHAQTYTTVVIFGGYAGLFTVWSDLPLKFHPTAIRVSAGFAPVGAMSCSA